MEILHDGGERLCTVEIFNLRQVKVETCPRMHVKNLLETWEDSRKRLEQCWRLSLVAVSSGSSVSESVERAAGTPHCSVLWSTHCIMYILLTCICTSATVRTVRRQYVFGLSVRVSVRASAQKDCKHNDMLQSACRIWWSLETKTNGLDFKVKRSKVKVTTRQVLASFRWVLL